MQIPHRKNILNRSPTIPEDELGVDLGDGEWGAVEGLVQRGELLVSPQEHDAGEPLPHVHVRRRDIVR